MNLSLAFKIKTKQNYQNDNEAATWPVQGGTIIHHMGPTRCVQQLPSIAPETEGSVHSLKNVSSENILSNIWDPDGTTVGSATSHQADDAHSCGRKWLNGHLQVHHQKRHTNGSSMPLCSTNDTLNTTSDVITELNITALQCGCSRVEQAPSPTLEIDNKKKKFLGRWT